MGMTGKVHRSVLYLWSAHSSVTKHQTLVVKQKAREGEGVGRWRGGGEWEGKGEGGGKNSLAEKQFRP